MDCIFLYVFGLLITYLTECVVDSKVLPSIPEAEAIDVALVENSFFGNPFQSNGMPQHMNLSVRLGQKDKVIALSLERNPVFDDTRNIYVLKTYSNGTQDLIKENIPFKKNECFYQDKSLGASIKITCDMSAGVCDPILMGSVYSDGEWYDLQPFEQIKTKQKIIPRQKRSSWHSGRLYAVYKRPNLSPTIDDFETTTERPGAAQHIVNAFVKTGRTVDLQNPTRASTSRHFNFQTPGEKRRYFLGLLIVVDHGLYNRILSQSNDADEAKAKIREKVAYIVNGVDLRYNNFRDFEINVVVTGYVMAEKDEDSIWTLNRIKNMNLDLVNASHVLRELITWRKKMLPRLPRHDHMILFTGYDLYDRSLVDDVVGFARLKTICSEESVSVVEDHGGFDNILSVTHELAHSLGASHDGDMMNGNSCDPSDNFIMTAVGGGRADTTKGVNSFRFSNCSERQILRHLESLPDDHCLSDEAIHHDREEFESHISIHLGQRYSPDEQCTLNMGYLSYYGWGDKLGNQEDICSHMACKNRLSADSFNIFTAYRGTTCGNKKICKDGMCIFDTDGPSADESCLHGDSKRMFGDDESKTCAEFLSQDPSYCYFGFYYSFCCETCNKLRRPIQGCEYGDKRDGCSDANCQNPDEARFCCDTCRQQRLSGTQRINSDNLSWDSLISALQNIQIPSINQGRSVPQMSKVVQINRPNRNSVPEQKQTTSTGIQRQSANNVAMGCETDPETVALCENTIGTDSIKCYSNSMAETCCLTCEKFRINVTGCEFGDRMVGCKREICNVPVLARQCCRTCGQIPLLAAGIQNSLPPSITVPINLNLPSKDCEQSPAIVKMCTERVNLEPMRCYIQRVREICCKTCEKNRNNAPGCEYGNKIRGCTRSACEHPEFRSQCCYTCAANVANNPPPTSIGSGQRQISTGRVNAVDPRMTTSVSAPGISGAKTNSNSLNNSLQSQISSLGNFRLSDRLTGSSSSSSSLSSSIASILSSTRQDTVPQKDTVSSSSSSGRDNYCFVPDARYFSVLCKWIKTFVTDICSNVIFKYKCCSRCFQQPSTNVAATDNVASNTNSCVDASNCLAEYGADCYIPSVRTHCCATCRTFETGIQDCEYGDKHHQCSSLYQFSPNVACSSGKRTTCCGTCSNQQNQNRPNFQARTNAQNRFQRRNFFHRSSLSSNDVNV